MDSNNTAKTNRKLQSQSVPEPSDFFLNSLPSVAQQLSASPGEAGHRASHMLSGKNWEQVTFMYSMSQCSYSSHSVVSSGILTLFCRLTLELIVYKNVPRALL